MDIVALITGALSLIKGTEAGSKRKNLKLAKRTFKQLRRQFKKGGFTKEETEMLKELQEAIIKRTIEL